jgi:hypothetical protein
MTFVRSLPVFYAKIHCNADFFLPGAKEESQDMQIAKQYVGRRLNNKYYNENDFIRLALNARKDYSFFERR